MGRVEFRVLGPLEIICGGQSVPLTSAREQRLVAMLLLAPNAIVPLRDLVEAVWDDHPPQSAKRQVQNRMSALRRRLHDPPGGDLIVTDGPGYRIRVQPGQLDAEEFARLASAPTPAETNLAAAAKRLDAALAMWRGPALAGMTGKLLEAGAAVLDEQRLATFERYVDLRLELGEHADVVGQLGRMVAANPLRERLVGLLMQALHRCARQAEALHAYDHLRSRLAEELGIDPSQELQQLRTTILRNECTRPSERLAQGVPDAPRLRVPAQLPLDVRGFTGRSSYLDRLDELFLGTPSQLTAAVICVITGTAGVGKTTLAVHWAHHRRGAFPGGQLYLNLRGFDQAGTATAPMTAIHRLLTGLGASPAAIPKDSEAQIALYRTMIDGRRLLIVLDNARDAEQVRPLLPGSASTSVLITSRRQLTSLVALNGAEQIVLDLPSEDEAIDLLSQRLDPARVAAERPAAARIVASCARLPLALTIAAGRAGQRRLPLADIADELAESGARLELLSAGDADSELWSVFSWSYDALPRPAMTLFRLLGLHCGPEISATAAATLAGLPVRAVTPLLESLTQASLLSEHAPGRFAFHDLLREYAAARCRLEDSKNQRVDAVDRMFGYYLGTAHAADRVLHPLRDPIGCAVVPADAAQVPTFAHRDQAMAWFAVEHPVLLAALRLAEPSTLDIYTWQLAWMLTTFLTRRGPWQDLNWAWQRGLAAAERLRDPFLQAEAHRHLAQVNTELRDFGVARQHSRHALRLYRYAGSYPGLGHTHYVLAWLYERQGRAAVSLRHAKFAHANFLRASHRYGQAVAHNGMAWCHVLLGEGQEALAQCHQALALHEQLGDEHGRADTWDTLGYAYHHLGRHDEATDCYTSAIELYRRLGDRYYEAATLIRLGDNHHSSGHDSQAQQAWQDALQILADLNHPEAEQVASRLLAQA